MALLYQILLILATPFLLLCQNYYIIRAQSVNENDGKIYVFKSEHLFFKPSFEELEKISVYVKPLNFKKYYMDIRELESKYVKS